MKLLDFAHYYIQEVLSYGDVAVDATVGNGFDTLFLARCVGKEGLVIGFDVQLEALAKTQQKITSEMKVELHHCGHETMETFLSTPIKACMFNLGYLPYADKSIVTQPESTLKAIKTALWHLAPKGRISIMVYVGHAGGKAEADAILSFVNQLNPQEIQVLKMENLGSPTAPFWIGLERLALR